jgi:hypothetical protein
MRLQQRVSMVVLPFVNNSGDASQEHLADALGDDLTTNVSRISGTFVNARNTAFTYKGNTYRPIPCICGNAFNSLLAGRKVIVSGLCVVGRYLGPVVGSVIRPVIGGSRTG